MVIDHRRPWTDFPVRITFSLHPEYNTETQSAYVPLAIHMPSCEPQHKMTRVMNVQKKKNLENDEVLITKHVHRVKSCDNWK